jgi:hypothetical protein
MQEKFLIKSTMKNLCIATLLLLCTLGAFAQTEEEGAKKDKLFAGGNFGLSFGRYTLISLNPQVGYRFNRFLSAGMGLNLVYASQKERFNGADYSKTTQGITGLNTFVRFYPVQRFLVQLQPEANYIFGNVKYYNPPGKYKLDAEIIPSLLVGGGLVTPTTGGAMLFTVMCKTPMPPMATGPLSA